MIFVASAQNATNRICKPFKLCEEIDVRGLRIARTFLLLFHLYHFIALLRLEKWRYFIKGLTNFYEGK